MDQNLPPPLPRPPALPPRKTKNWRWAATLNLFLPGAGLFYLGRRKSGAALVTIFLAFLIAALGIFLTGYVQYLQTVMGGDLMKEGELERLKDVFHQRWLLGLLGGGLGVYVISMFALAGARRDTLRKAEAKVENMP
jgi:hypothetical protein